LTGHGIDVLICDDPVKSRLEAESSTYRERLVDWWRDVAATRIEPGGSAFVFMTRWHPDDLSGHLIGEGFDSILLPAIDDDGRPLWPERWPLEALEERRSEVGEFTWASLFQGAPRPRGGRVFGDVSTYAQLPASFRAAIGLDLAYSEATSADYSVAVRMARKGDLFYVVDVMRKQEQAPRFKALCSAWNGRHPTDPWRWYAAGVERGAASFFREPPAIPLNVMAPLGDKFVRAISYAAAWNAGRVVLPERAPWLDAFVAEHAGFTGRNDKHDDQIDAAVAAFDQLNCGEADIPPRPPKVKATGLAAVDL
jgi:predicted phage terminase large subunit-like protein